MAGDATLILFSGLAGVLVTVTAGFIGAWLQSRREHSKWVRERRLEAFTKSYRTITSMLNFQRDQAQAIADLAGRPGELVEHLVEDQRRLREIRDEAMESVVALDLLGTLEVSHQASRVKQMLTARADTDAVLDAIEEMVTAMRNAIGVRGEHPLHGAMRRVSRMFAWTDYEPR